MIKKDLDINFKILVKIENWFVNLLFYFYIAGKIDGEDKEYKDYSP